MTKANFETFIAATPFVRFFGPPQGPPEGLYPKNEGVLPDAPTPRVRLL
jgi:hypothetical protein